MHVEEYPFVDPVSAYKTLAKIDACHLLDSGNRDGFAYIAAGSIHKLTARDGQVTLDGNIVSGAPFAVLADVLDQYQLLHNPALPPFQGGAVGYFGYDLCQQLEHLPTPGQDWLDIPDMMVGIHDVVVSFDLSQRRMWIISHGFPATQDSDRQSSSRKRVRQIRDCLRGAGARDLEIPAAPQPPAITPWQSNFTRTQYENAVQRVKDYIFDGDIFQANLSQSFFAQYGQDQLCDPFGLYRRLSSLSPAPFGAFLDFGDVSILSNSPERFLKVGPDGQVESKPIKGTRPRGKTPVEDAKFAQDLLLSEKDHAENVMIVDLLRNDLSRVCQPHTVDASNICQLESFANVHHLVSTVTGTLEGAKTAIDALVACFPGGSITGAPKIRAMEIITELENRRRSVYCGAIGFIGFDGVMDTNIAIRTLAVHNGRMAFNVGGGIVADSIPAHEYDETLSKAEKLMAALGISAENA
ncbi:aminodeoxychorismate synthase component I [Thalassospira mesophila]|uniref:aminodeoxychorismate synthase n=1 Tax=Thalassospira mesophila TaxID=1293891 RepID=A0A1Y2L0D2_9PROT|nr:aminodeoxychorismate synthase component I [Thalassospira mesophila]OSQ37773.1 aminobenzoate synthetase [Thalassospira mesophila]